MTDQENEYERGLAMGRHIERKRIEVLIQSFIDEKLHGYFWSQAAQYIIEQIRKEDVK